MNYRRVLSVLTATLAWWRFRRFALVEPFFHGHGMQSKRMDTMLKLLLQRLVDQAVACHGHLVLEVVADDDNLEMRLGAFRNIMHVALIDNFEVLWRQGLFEFAGNSLLHVHRIILSCKAAGPRIARRICILGANWLRAVRGLE